MALDRSYRYRTFNRSHRLALREIHARSHHRELTSAGAHLGGKFGGKKLASAARPGPAERFPFGLFALEPGVLGRIDFQSPGFADLTLCKMSACGLFAKEKTPSENLVFRS